MYNQNMADSESDPILLPLLETKLEKRESFLSELISTHAKPVIKKIVYYRLNVHADRADTKESWDAEDVCSGAVVQLLSHLSKFSENPQEHPIHDFRGYTAVVAHHACNQYFRQKFPKRTQLSNKLRYLMNHNRQFAIWNIDNSIACGLQNWKGASPVTPTQESVVAINKLQGKTTENVNSSKLSVLLMNVFQILNAPLFFDDLIRIMIDLLGVRELKQVDDKRDEKQGILEQIEDQRANTSAQIQYRNYLKKLWDEMIALPLRQRTALLLSIRDQEGGSVLHLLPVTRIASIHAIAECVIIPVQDFAYLWDKLPLEDNEIASRLGVTRQQVINLRRSARERLARRMKQY
jgi:RNA polymerase sigma factor (sigma-70 family)